jgi:aminoglycoside phosphotransferase (APT) family kinase protein
VVVHGDSHAGNIMRGDAAAALQLIDFDMTAVGPAGSELGFLAMMLFRCGFAPELVLPRAAQRRFAAGYLEAVDGSAAGAAADEATLDQLLYELHCWSYFGCLKMG